MIWSDWVTALANELDMSATITNAASATPSTDPNFNNALPRIIDYTENRIQRDLDLIDTYVTDESGTLTANNRKFTLPTDKGIYVVVTQVYAIVSGVNQAPMLPISLEALSQFYPNSTNAGVPVCWAPNDGTTILVGPAPDSNYGIGIVGTQRFAQLSATNTSNFLTLQLPDLYMAASLVWGFGHQRDFGAQSDDPRTAQSWEAQYQILKNQAIAEEVRKKFESVGWTGRLPSPDATPPQS